MSNNQIITQKRNKSHKDFFDDTTRWLISFGGAGSAKSYSTAQKILLDRIMQEPNHKYLVCRKVAKTLRVSVFQLFKDLISAFEALVTADEEAWSKLQRVIPANKVGKVYELGKNVIE